ncbi:MAG TPA: UPF0182 family protein, partial [Longimicrobiales bacterium]|nr:UPF0182 family protein [Longimicrobiales bacterium]
GAVVAPAHRTASDDAPALWLRSVRPVIRSPSSPPGLELTHPSVYFGESLDDYAIVVPGRDSTFDGQPGVDQPRGVPLSSFARVLAFSWRLGDVNLLFSGEVDRTSRLILRRSLQERLEAVAPFILWDPDALPVIQDGRIVWMVDGYTASASFPLSRGVTLGQTSVRYLRAAVKGTIDAVTGATTIHVVDPADPLIRTYQRLFPALLRPLEAMPAELRRHLRYPELMLVTQAEILQEYHVERPEVFYTGEDMWERPQEAAPTGGLIPYRPTYALMPLPREEELEYLATLPFIARSRQNMTGLLVARNDPGRYGDLILYRFPTDQQVPGPGQVQALIEQDPVISPELSLLRQRGTGIDMGHPRLIPLDSSVLYVQPLFLSADENPIPALWRVVVSDGENVGLGDDLYAALATLDLPVSARDTATAPATGGWPTQALRLLDAAEASLRDGDWEGYGRRLEQLRRLLSGLQGGGPSGADAARPPAGVNP